MKNGVYVGIGVIVLAVAAVGAWLWPRAPAPVVPTAAPASSVGGAPVARPAAPASEPPIRHPIEASAAAASAPAPLDVEAALTELFGRKTTLAMFQLSEFPRRLAATVDNLGRAHAPARLWPVNPAPDRFMVQTLGGDQVIAPDNSLRYTPYVLLIETVDLRQAVAAYARLYPLFQQAYEDLGYPKRYFNDRLVEVIDLLVATPDLDQPAKVHLPAINSPMQPERPWVLYEFDEPTLQSLSAGQKILLRMGPVNERRVKAKLAELRGLVARAAPR